MRRLLPLMVLLALPACRPYERYGYVTTDKGMIPADEFAKYGVEQAIAVAIGREYAHAYAGMDSAGYARQADSATAYSKKFELVKAITADTMGHRLVVTFASGWKAQVVPISDGTRGDETPGLPKAK